MPRARITVTLDDRLLKTLDRLVHQDRFPNRSRAIEQALCEEFPSRRRTRRVTECAHLDPEFEQKLAEGIITGY